MTLTVTDHFAGAGGSSTGMVQIPGVVVTQAANHWPLAIAVHNQNHPDTDHAAVDLHLEKPSFFRTTDILWASPECTKWSQAAGMARPSIEEGLFEDPLSDGATYRSRLLMFDVLKFVEHHRYKVVIVENVVDIAVQAKYRLAWYAWRRQLMGLGYAFRVVSLNAMHAQTFGDPAPQSRDRIYIVAWLKGNPAPDLDRIIQPRAYCTRCAVMVTANQSWKNGATVGRYRQSYLYVHGACGTTVEPGWLPAAAAIDWSVKGERIGDRTKKLADKTRARVAAGIARYWSPFHLEAAGNTYDAATPCHPNHAEPGAYYRAWGVDEPLRSLHPVASKALAVPVEGRAGKQAQPVTQPLRTQTTRHETALLTPFVAELRGGGSDARKVTDPAATFCASGNHHALVTPYYGNCAQALPVDRPIGTLTTVDRYALIHRHNTGGAEMTTPVTEYLRTLTTAGHQSLIQQPETPSRRPVTAADLSTAAEMVDECFLRMFMPSEVAAGMAFPSTYRWDVLNEHGRPPSNRDLVRMGGNAVCPPCSRDIMGVIAEAYAP